MVGEGRREACVRELLGALEGFFWRWVGDGTQLGKEGNLTLGVCGKVWIRCLPGLMELMWGAGGYLQSAKGEEKKGKICEKKGKKESPSQATVRYSSERKREKNALLLKQRKTPFLSLKN